MKIKKYKFIKEDSMKADLEVLESLIVRSVHTLKNSDDERVNRAMEEFVLKYDNICVR